MNKSIGKNNTIETYIKEKISQQNNIIMHWLAYIAPHSRHHEIKKWRWNCFHDRCIIVKIKQKKKRVIRIIWKNRYAPFILYAFPLMFIVSNQAIIDYYGLTCISYLLIFIDLKLIYSMYGVELKIWIVGISKKYILHLNFDRISMS